MTQPTSYTPCVLVFSEGLKNGRFLTLPHDTLFSCTITSNREQGSCVICAPSVEIARGLFHNSPFTEIFKPSATSEIEPFSLRDVHNYFVENPNNTFIITAPTEHKGRLCLPSVILPPVSRLQARNAEQLLQRSDAELFKNYLQHDLFNALILGYQKKMHTRLQPLGIYAPIRVNELLMLDGLSWADATQNRQKVSKATLDGGCPVRIVDTYSYFGQDDTFAY